MTGQPPRTAYLKRVVGACETIADPECLHHLLTLLSWGKAVTVDTSGIPERVQDKLCRALLASRSTSGLIAATAQAVEILGVLGIDADEETITALARIRGATP